MNTPSWFLANKRKKYPAKSQEKFWLPEPRGLSKSTPLDADGKSFQNANNIIRRYARCIPGIEAEERHIAEAIAVNLREMATFEVPIIVCVIGEGGSGGALGVAVADYVIVLENAYYSVISPEGCAAILWKDRSFASDASVAKTRRR